MNKKTKAAAAVTVAVGVAFVAMYPEESPSSGGEFVFLQMLEPDDVPGQYTIAVHTHMPGGRRLLGGRYRNPPYPSDWWSSDGCYWERDGTLVMLRDVVGDGTGVVIDPDGVSRVLGVIREHDSDGTVGVTGWSPEWYAAPGDAKPEHPANRTIYVTVEDLRFYSSDVNEDGVVDTQDFLMFLNMFAEEKDQQRILYTSREEYR